MCPIHARIADQPHDAGRNMDGGIPIGPPGFQQQHAAARILAQPRGKRTTSRTRPDNNDIGLHLLRPYGTLMITLPTCAPDFR